MKKINQNFYLLLKYSFFFFAVFGLTSGCGKSSFTSESPSLVKEDPLFKYAWHLYNIGQTVFASTPATAGFDLNLTNTWKQQLYCNGILIQISDDGLEDTHEDLKANFSYLNQSKNYTLVS